MGFSMRTYYCYVRAFKMGLWCMTKQTTSTCLPSMLFKLVFCNCNCIQYSSTFNMSDSFASDVKAYYAAKEFYESLLRDSKNPSATTRKDGETEQKKEKEQERHPLLIPSFGELAFSKAAQQGGKSAGKKSS